MGKAAKKSALKKSVSKGPAKKSYVKKTVEKKTLTKKTVAKNNVAKKSQPKTSKSKVTSKATAKTSPRRSAVAKGSTNSAKVTKTLPKKAPDKGLKLSSQAKAVAKATDAAKKIKAQNIASVSESISQVEKSRAKKKPTLVASSKSKRAVLAGSKIPAGAKIGAPSVLKSQKVEALSQKHREAQVVVPRPAATFDPTMTALSETANTPVEKLAKKWNTLFKKSAKIETQPYHMRKVFEEKTGIEHKVLGWGYILSNKNDRLEVLFKDGVRFLISNYQG